LQIEELLYEEESPTLDFKSEQYKFINAENHEKVELLKDILAFANAWRRTDAFILIGVEEVKGGRSIPIGINDDLDDAQLQQFINSKTQRPIEFEYKATQVDNVKAGVIRIPVQKRPFYLKKDFCNLKRHIVYLKRGSSTDEADPDEIHKMGMVEIKDAQEVPNLSFEFANIDNRASLGSKLQLTAVVLDIQPDTPKYKEKKNYIEMNGIREELPKTYYVNDEYYRELVLYYFIKSKSNKISFLLKNDSSSTLTDVKVEVRIDKAGNDFHFFKSHRFLKLPVKTRPMHNFQPIQQQVPKKKFNKIETQDIGDSFLIQAVFDKVQAKQTVFSEETIYILTNDDFNLVADTTIYADNIPEPIKTNLEISCKTIKEDGSLKRIKKLHRQNKE